LLGIPLRCLALRGDRRAHYMWPLRVRKDSRYQEALQKEPRSLPSTWTVVRRKLLAAYSGWRHKFVAKEDKVEQGCFLPHDSPGWHNFHILYIYRNDQHTNDLRKTSFEEWDLPYIDIIYLAYDLPSRQGTYRKEKQNRLSKEFVTLLFLSVAFTAQPLLPLITKVSGLSFI
jgi:hypothetical protein